MSNRRLNRNRELWMVESRHGSVDEWTREGEQKGKAQACRTEYVRRRWLFVKKSRRIKAQQVAQVRNEWARTASSRVVPQEFKLLSLQLLVEARVFCFPSVSDKMKGEMKNSKATSTVQNLSHGRRDTAGVVQHTRRHEDRPQTDPASGHAPANDSRRTLARILRGAC